MSRKALYTVSVRLSKEHIQKLQQYQEENNIQTKSECLQKAIAHLLEPRENNKTSYHNILEDKETIDKLTELILQRLQNQTFTLTKK